MLESQAVDAPQNSEAESTRSSPFGSTNVHAGLLMAAVAAVLLGLWWYLDYQSRGKILQSINGATIQAHSVIVAPKVGGYIDRVFVAENQTTRVGQPLALLGTRDYPLHQRKRGPEGALRLMP